MELLQFAIKAKFSGFFRQQRAQRIFFLVLGLIAAGFYSWMFGFMMEQARESDMAVSTTKVLSYANLLLLALTIMRGFFPAYIPKSDIIPRIYPVKAGTKFMVEMATELTSPYYFVLLCFLALLFSFSADYTLVHLVQSVLVVLTAQATRSAIQLFIERRIKWLGKDLFTAATAAAGFVGIQTLYPMYEPAAAASYLGIHAGALLFLVASNYFLEQAAYEPKQKVVHYSHNARRSLGWRLFNNHKLAKQMSMFALVLKVLILAADAIVYSKKGIHLYDKNLALWLFMGPLILYTYVFNNIWGFYRNLWLTTERTSGRLLDFLKSSLLPLRIPLLIDATIVAIYLAFFNHGEAVFIVSMYLASVLVLTPIGIVSSFVAPKAVRGGVMSFSAKTSYLYTFLSMFVAGLLFLPILHPVLYLLYPLLVGLVLFALVAVLREYTAYKYKIFEALYKVEG